MARSNVRTTDNFLKLFRYNEWANDRILQTLRRVDDVPERALELFSHLLRAQDMWYGRVEDTEHTSLSLWETDDLSTCAQRSTSSTDRWMTLLEDCEAGDLDAGIAYENTSGTSFETPLRDILSHVINHGTHHRAQIALVLRRADIEPPPTDYIFFVREE